MDKFFLQKTLHLWSVVVQKILRLLCALLVQKTLYLLRGAYFLTDCLLNFFIEVLRSIKHYQLRFYKNS